MYISFRTLNNIPICNFIIDSSTVPPADRSTSLVYLNCSPEIEYSKYANVGT